MTPASWLHKLQRLQRRRSSSYLIALRARTMQSGFCCGEPIARFEVICLLLGSAALFVGALPVDGHAQGSASAVPDNARQRSYGWDCNRGFRETAGRCVAVIVPSNAYLSPEGTSWTCNRGFRAEGAACKAVQAP